MNINFERCLALVLVHEGGYVDHPADPGGATNLGVTIGTLSRVLGRPATKAEVKALTKQTVAPVYRANYWNAVHGDLLPAGVDYAVFDFAVNSGPRRAIQALQRAVGVADDGRLGPITLAAVQKYPSGQVVERVCADRMSFLRRLSTWPTFGKGWSRRVDGVLKDGLAMSVAAALNPKGPSLPATPAPHPITLPQVTPQVPAATGMFAGMLVRLRAAYPRKAS